MAAERGTGLQADSLTDPFIVYEQFIARKLRTNELPDVFLADLRRLSSLLGGVSEKTLACAFVAGLPRSVRLLLKAGSCMEDLTLNEILVRARAIIMAERSASSRGEYLSCGQ